MIKSYEAFSKKLHDSLLNKEEGLKYFDTYPYEPEELRRRKEFGLRVEYPYEPENVQIVERPAVLESGGSTMDDARKTLPAHTAVIGTSQTAPGQSNQTTLPGPKPTDTQNPQQDLHPNTDAVTPLVGAVAQEIKRDDIPVVRDERSSHSSPKTQLLDTSVGPKLPVQHRLSDLELTPKMDAEIKRFWKGLWAINDSQRSIVDSMRSLTIKFANEISKNQELVLTSAFNAIEAATTMFRVVLDFMYDRMTMEEWEQIRRGDDSVQFDDLPFYKDFRRWIFPIQVVSEIFQESLSEASAEIPNDKKLPSWTAVMDFFEWKAGYNFEKCLSDCAVIRREMISDEEGPNIDRSELVERDPGARTRLDQMIEHRKLFRPTGLS